MMATTTPNAISDVDRDALERALAIMLRHRELGGDKRRIAEGQVSLALRQERWYFGRVEAKG